VRARERHGPDRVELACRRALDAEAVNVGLIERMLARGLETESLETEAGPTQPGSATTASAAGQQTLPIDLGAGPPRPSTVVAAAGRFVRDPDEFATRSPHSGDSSDVSDGGIEQTRRPS